MCLIHLLKLPVRTLLLVNRPRFSCGNVPNRRATSRMLTTFPVPLLFLLQEGESVSSASAFYSGEILDILAKCIEKWKQVETVTVQWRNTFSLSTKVFKMFLQRLSPSQDLAFIRYNTLRKQATLQIMPFKISRFASLDPT